MTRGTLAPRAPAKRHSHYNLEELKFSIYAKCVIYYHTVFHMEQLLDNSPICTICLGSLSVLKLIMQDDV